MSCAVDDETRRQKRYSREVSRDQDPPAHEAYEDSQVRFLAVIDSVRMVGITDGAHERILRLLQAGLKGQLSMNRSISALIRANNAVPAN